MASRAFPELNLLESATERRKVSRTAFRAVMRTRHFWLCWLGAAVSAVTAMLFVYGVFMPWLRQHASLPDWLVKMVMAALVTGVAAGGWQLALRRPTRRRIRRELLARGIPVCLDCGYDLRGRTGPCCPECGRTFEPMGDERAGAP